MICPECHGAGGKETSEGWWECLACIARESRATGEKP